MEIEQEIPVCDVFKGDEAFWTEKFTGSTSELVRAKYKFHSEMTLTARRELNKKMSRGSLGLSDKAKKTRSKLMSEASTKRWSVEGARQAHGIKTSEGMQSVISSLSESELIARSTFTSLVRFKRWEDIPYKEYSKFCSTMAGVWARISPEEKSSWVRNCRKGTKFGLGKTLPELSLEIYLKRNFPGEWIYNGQNQADFIIGGKIPDFVNINGRKAVIEVFGTFFHFECEVEEKVNYYKSLGYECLVIWEYDTFLVEELDKIFKEAFI